MTVPWKGVLIGLIVIALGGALALHLRNDRRTLDDLTKLRGQANTVVIALRRATDDPEADWKTTPGRIDALGTAHKQLKLKVDEQNLSIDQMAAEAVRLRAKASELHAIAEKA